MSKVAFISGGDLASLFGAFGISAFSLKEKEDPGSLLKELVDKDYRIIYILEDFASGYIGKIDEIRQTGNASIVIIPDHKFGAGLGMELTRLAAIDAIGSDAVFIKDKEVTA